MCVHLRIFRNDKNLNYQFNFFFNLKNKIIFLIVRRFYYFVPRASGVHKGMQRVISLWSLEIINRWLIAAKIIDWWILLDLIAKTKLESPKKHELNGFIVNRFENIVRFVFWLGKSMIFCYILFAYQWRFFKPFRAHMYFSSPSREI